MNGLDIVWRSSLSLLSISIVRIFWLALHVLLSCSKIEIFLISSPRGFKTPPVQQNNKNKSMQFLQSAVKQQLDSN